MGKTSYPISTHFSFTAISIKNKNRASIENYEIKISNQNLKLNSVSMGNPHTVIFVNNLENIKLAEWGKIIENMKLFPEKTNVEFIQILNSNKIKMKVWERGSGITLSCGTGACAAAAVGIKKNLIKNPVEVILPGGKLQIEWKNFKAPIKMTGNAETIFTGKYLKEVI